MDPKLSVPSPAEENPQDEKRRNLRIPLRVLRVETKIQGDVFFGHATNISKTGLFIQTANPKPTGTKVHIRFNLPDTQEKIACLAEVSWIQDYTGQKGPQPGMGLKFVELSPEADHSLNRFVEEQANEVIDDFSGN